MDGACGALRVATPHAPPPGPDPRQQDRRDPQPAAAAMRTPSPPSTTTTTTASAFGASAAAAPAKRTRTRTGCLNCRRKKRKCDEGRPACGTCCRRREHCEWGLKVTFRAENAQGLDDRHPSMRKVARRRPPREFEILNVTSEVIRDYNAPEPLLESDEDDYSDGRGGQMAAAVVNPAAAAPDHRSVGGRPSPFGHDAAGQHDFYPQTTTTYISSTPTGTIASPPSVAGDGASPGSHWQTQSAVEHLLLLRQSGQSAQQQPPSSGPTSTPASTLTAIPTRAGPAANVCIDPALQAALHHHHTPMPIDMRPSNYAYIDSVEAQVRAQAFTPEGIVEDGIFLPGSTYQELHKTLRNHLIQEVRPVSQPARSGAGPGSDGSGNGGQGGVVGPDDEDADGEDVDGEDASPYPFPHRKASLVGNRLAGGSGRSSPPPAPITPVEECALWSNYFDEPAQWMDKFDPERNFKHTLPSLAKRHAHLRWACLALSARQLELKAQAASAPAGGEQGQNQNQNRSLALYQEAIHTLLPELPTRAPAVIATCMVLCVLEMLSCAPRAWQRHLDGCAVLMDAVGINGVAGGVGQSLFWCFARMDVSSGLTSSVRTLIPVSHWVGAGSLAADVARFRAEPRFEHWANHALYLLAQVIELLTPSSSSSSPRPRTPSPEEAIGSGSGSGSERGPKRRTKRRPPPGAEQDPVDFLDSAARRDPRFRARWLELWGYVCDWYRMRPPPMLPVMSISGGGDGKTHSPFPTILYSNPSAISGNQMYHTTSILMLQNQPPSLRLTPRPRSILWHARQICGIGTSNHDHAAWTNGVQPLWIAGRCMSHPVEHRAILDLLERIERESGWGTRYRQEDLKEFWGDLGD